MNDLSEKLLKILTTELSEITGKSIINHYTRKIGKDPWSLTPEDLPEFSKAMLESIFLFSDPDKAYRITREVRSLTPR
jgi:hypothetical protein